MSIIPHYRKPIGDDDLQYRKLGDTDDDTPSDSSATGRNEYAPSYYHPHNNRTTTTFINNKAIHADVRDIVANNRESYMDPTLRSKLLDAAVVHETLIANTSWGFVQIKVPYTCSPQESREYEFGLPNNLMFVDGGGGWYARRNTTPTIELAYLFGDWTFNPTRDNTDPFLYRVYMNNPSERELRIWKVYTTKTWLVGAEYQTKHDVSTASAESYLPMKRASSEYPFKGNVKGLGNNIYVATVRLFPDQMTLDMISSIQDLGFLKVETNLGEFSIALDFIPNIRKGGMIYGTGENLITMPKIHLVREHIMTRMIMGLVHLKDPNMTVVKTYRANDKRSSNETLVKTFAAKDRVIKTEVQGGQGGLKNDDSSASNATQYISASPSHVNFGSITTGSRMIRIPVKLVNLHTENLKIMRVSVVLSTNSENGDGNITDIYKESHRMEIGVDLSGDGSSPALAPGGHSNPIFPTKTTFSTNEQYFVPGYIVLPGTNMGYTAEYTMYVWCKFVASPDETVLPRFYSGKVLIQATEDIYVQYPEWQKQLLLEHSSFSSRRTPEVPYVLEIPFEGSVLPGNLGSPTEALLFPTHFLVLPLEERMKIMQRSSGKIPGYYDRELEITNNFAVPISIMSMQVLESTGDDFCKSRFSTPDFNKDGGAFQIAKNGEKWKGLSVRYHFDNDEESSTGNGVTVRKCILSLETDRAGKQSLPLIIYSGEIVVDIERTDGTGQPLTVHCLVTRKDGSTMASRSGMPCMKDWMENTPEGEVLEKAIQKQTKPTGRLGVWKTSRKKNCRIAEQSPVNSYFDNLLSSSSKVHNAGENPNYAIQPVVLSFGAIPAGESTSRRILLSNLNHIPVDIMATTAVLGNMDVSIGVIPTSEGFFDAFNDIEEDPSKRDKAYFLEHSPMARSFFSKFNQKFDILPSPRAQGTELYSLFHRHYVADVFQNGTEYIDGNFIGDEYEDMACSSGLLVSTDGTYEEVIDTRKTGKKKWTIPPGGVARFMVTVKAPPKSKLQNDVTPLVGTGLVLETSLGQALPIVVTYSAISGQLQLRPSRDFNETDVIADTLKAGIEYNASAPLRVQVPMTFKDPTITPSVDYFAQRRGVSLSIESTFHKDIYLNEIRSCNKWFNVFLPSNNPEAKEFFSKKGYNNFLRIAGRNETPEEASASTVLSLGKVLSALSCSHPSSDTSFFACALAWLENRDQIQAPGCGLSEDESIPMNATVLTGDRLESRINIAKTNAIGALRDVVAFLSVRYVDEKGDKPPNPAENKSAYIHFSRILMFQHARKMWNEVVKLGLNTITGHLDAKTVFFETPQKAEKNKEATTNEVASAFTSENPNLRPPPLSIPVSSVLLQSALEIPELFMGDRNEKSVGVVEFETTHVADTTTRFVPIMNPTAMSIRVRLTAIDSADGSFGEDSFAQKNVFVQNIPTDRHSWWTGGSYWMSDDEGHLISASHNVTIKSGAGAFVSLLNPAVHSMSAFILGCGRRCGLRNEQEANGEEKNYSPIGAASGDGSALMGRTYGDKSAPQNEKKTPQRALGITDPPSFSLGRVANEIVIPPYGKAELGPVHFRPPGRGVYEGSIYIENSLTGFEEVKLRGRGGWEKLVFLDQVNSSGDGGDIEFRFGQSALIFPGSQIDRPPGTTGPVVKSIRLANHGDFPVDITRVHMSSSEVMHYTHKRRHPSSSSQSDRLRDPRNKKCSARGFVLPGCVDSFSSVWMETLYNWGSSLFDFFVSDPSESDSARSAYAKEAEKFYKNGFTLQPNQTQTIYVLHYPDCTFQTSYASVIFDIGDRGHETAHRGRLGSWQQTFKEQKVELLVGYDMSASQFRQCVPYLPPETTIWERKIEIQLPPILQDMLSFGLTRFTDANGDPYIPRRPIQITLVAASFLMLLFALSLDLLFTVEVSGNRKTCPSWKPTCRCLARADPPSSDLVSIGKEQTKHVLLSRFKKEGVLPSHCVLSDGSFGREKAGSSASGTHSEAIFDRLNLVNESKMSEKDEDEPPGLLSCGIGWRTAMRRGIGLPTSPNNNTSCNSIEQQYLARTRDRYVKKQQEQKAAMKAASTTERTKASVTFAPSVKVKTNGHPAVEKQTKPAVPAPLPQDRKVEHPIKKDQTPVNGKIKVFDNKSQGQPNSDLTTSAATNATTTDKPAIVVGSSSKPAAEKANNAVNGKLKNQQKASPGVTSLPVQQSEQKSKIAEKKVKQKQYNEAKSSKSANEAESKFISKQEPSTSKSSKSVTSEKTRPAKVSTESIASGAASKGKRAEKVLDVQVPASSPRSKEELPTQGKKLKTKKPPSNGTKNTEQSKGKQGKQKQSKKGTTKNHPKPSPVSTPKSTGQSNKPASEFEPASPTPAPQAATPNRAHPTSQKVGIRPPPGLLAPPGFLDQPDLEGISNPSSPASSPQRSTTHRSTMIQPIPADGIPGMEIVSSPPLNNDLLSLFGSEDKPPLESSSLFIDSPRSGSDGGLDSGLSIPQFRPQSFTPPILEPPSTADTNGSEAPSDVQALLGAGSNFNVSNFLDGILSDSTPQPPVQPPIAASKVIPEPAKVPESIPFQANNTLGRSLDPWNSLDNKNKTNHDPLAALQGAVNQQESSFIAGIPLNNNAPSLLSTPEPQNTANATYAQPAFASLVVSDEGGDDSDFLEPDSFYNQLLGED